jgi:hypothetical protein
MASELALKDIASNERFLSRVQIPSPDSQPATDRERLYFAKSIRVSDDAAKHANEPVGFVYPK